MFFCFHNKKIWVYINKYTEKNLYRKIFTCKLKNNEVVRVGGVKYTIKDGIIYDTKRLLKEVKNMVNTPNKKKILRLNSHGIKPNRKLAIFNFAPHSHYYTYK